MVDIHAATDNDICWYSKLSVIVEEPYEEEQIVHDISEISSNPPSTTTSPPQQRTKPTTKDHDHVIQSLGPILPLIS